MAVSQRDSVSPQTPVSINPKNGPSVAVRLPDAREDVSQDEEWFEVQIDGEWRRLRFHDYDEVYKIPGLYEHIFYERLRCESPKRVAGLLKSVLRDVQLSPKDLRVLDVGAGNGMVGEELREIGAQRLVGIDIIPEAAEAAERDRPGLYDDYLVADLTDLTPEQQQRLRDAQFNALTTVAALGFGDMPPLAFANAYNFVKNDGWIAFNVKENFLRQEDDTGFARLIRALMDRGDLQMHAYRRYCHRLSVAGNKLYYIAMVARKRRDVADEVLEQIQ